MFDRIIIQSQKTIDSENPLDLAFLAETMLFYGNVEVVAGRAAISQLVRELGPDLLLEFLSQHYLKVRFERNFIGIYTQREGGYEEHTPTVAQIEGQDLIDILRPLTISAVGRDGRGRRLARQLVDKIETRLIEGDVANRVRIDYENPRYTQQCVETILRFFLPKNDIPTHVRFAIIPTGEAKYRVETNLDFPALNRGYHQCVPVTHSSLSPGYLLGHILSNRKMFEEAARDSAEFAVAPLHKDLVSLKVASLLVQRERSDMEIEAFQNVALDDSRNFSGVLASKERSFRDLLPLLEKASKFRHWLQEQPPTAELLKAYHQAVTRESWVDRLPVKALRWAIFVGAGVVADAFLEAGGLGKITGITLGAADTFLLDKLIRGWKPSQFVNGPLREFTARARDAQE